MGYYHIWTVGCQMNKADSRHLGEELERRGLVETDRLEAADVVVLNSCVVRQGAEDRVMNRLATLRKLKKAHPNVVLALMGCMVPSTVQELQCRFKHVDLFMKPQQFDGLLELLEGRPDLLERRDIPAERAEAPYPVASFVPIIQGCDEMCTYCVVPLRRGREKSRPAAEIVAEVERLVGRGVREVTLLGQIVDRWGHDLPGRPDLADLLAEVAEVPGLARIRFLTPHPAYMADRLLDAIARIDKVCPQINVPLQSGDDAVLLAMRRGYTADAYRRLIGRIRDRIPGLALSTDVIVGFCGETRAQFEATYRLLEELRFDVVHVAAYSPRPGTYATRELADDVPPEEKQTRLQEVEALQGRVAAEINAGLVGQTVEVLVEGQTKGKWQGRAPTNKLVFFADDADRLGRLVLVQVEQAGPWSLQGRSVGPSPREAEAAYARRLGPLPLPPSPTRGGGSSAWIDFVSAPRT